MRTSDTPLLEAERIAARVAELGAEISRDCGGADLVLIVVLKGAFMFAADLARVLSTCVQVDFIRAKSYGKTSSSGEVRFLQLPETPLTDRHVLVVEDILDTGRTASAILAHIAAQGPASLKLCTLLDKPSRRVTPVKADYTGFTIDSHFVVGYGLDYEEQYREMDAVYLLENE